MFALNVSGDPGVNLLAINVSVFSLFLLKAQFGQIYKKKFVDVIEMACYANLGIFSTIKLKFGDGKIVNITTHISGVFTVLLLVVIISYHSMDIMLNSKCSKRHRYTENQIQRSDNSSDTTVRDSASKENYPTYSVVDIGQPAHCGRHSSAKIVVTSENDQVLKLMSEVDDDRTSLSSTDSTSPLLNECN